MRYIFIFIVLLFVCYGVGYGRPNFAVQDFSIRGASGSVYDFRGELARFPDELSYGLKFRDFISDDYGMVFDLGSVRRAGFWMRDTYISLDMIFIGEDGIIESILDSVPPHSESLRRSLGMVRWVVEVRGGLSRELGITAGDSFILR